MVIDKDCVLQTPLWYHKELQLQTIPQWNSRGVRTIGDLLNQNWRAIITQNEFEEYYQLKTNFLEYESVKMIVKECMTRKDMPLHNHLNPQNSFPI